MSEDNAPAVNEEVVTQETTATESAPVETKEPEVAESPIDWDEGEKDTKSEDETDGKDEETPADETEAEEQPQGEEKPLAPKSQNRFQRLANENRELRQQVEQLNAQIYQPATEEELVEQGLSPEMAAIEALKQDREIERYNNQVADAQIAIDNDAARVLNDFPMFDPNSDQFKPEVAGKAAQLLENNLIFDQNTGQIVGSKLPPYQIYETIAAAHQVSATENQLKGQRATQQMLASADAPTSAGPPKKPKDPIADIWDND